MFYYLFLCISIFITLAQPSICMEIEDKAVSRLREYLRIDTSPPNPENEKCVAWIRQQAQEIGLEFRRHDFNKPDLFTIVLTWRGSDPKLKSILLNSHLDVVPAEHEKWIHGPFSAAKDSKGNIYARGAQDRKSLGGLYLEAIRKLKATNYVPLRTVHISFVPDEELGGLRGMKPFTESQVFQKLNIGFALDEGLYGQLYYGQRSLWQFNVTATGRSSHAKFMLPDEDNAGTKLLYVMNKLFELRKQQMVQMGKDRNNASEVTSINLSLIGGGIQANVVPTELWAVFDMRLRLRPNWQYTDAEKFLSDTCTEAGPGVSYTFIMESRADEETKVDDSNPWWTLMRDIHMKMGKPLLPGIRPGGADAKYLREAGIPTFGYSTIEFEEVLSHQHNEYINEKSYLEGILMFQNVLHTLASHSSGK